MSLFIPTIDFFQLILAISPRDPSISMLHSFSSHPDLSRINHLRMQKKIDTVVFSANIKKLLIFSKKNLTLEVILKSDFINDTSY